MRLLILPFVLALSACSLTPELVTPDLPVPLTYPGKENGTTQTHAADLGWRTMFRDQRLQRLIELALQNNRDLRLAVLNVEAVRAQYGIQHAAQLPFIDIMDSSTRQRTAASSDTSASIRQEHSLNIGLNAFEIDLFGRMRAQSDAAFARFLASEHGSRATQISLIGAVADAYFTERMTQEQQSLAEHTLTDWRQSLELARKLKNANQSSGLDVTQAEGQTASAEADLEARKRAVAQARNALNLLVGMKPPEDLPSPLPLSELSTMTTLPAGLPSDLLLRRPDILQTEQNLVAANAEIGAARAAFFPRLSLTTSLGYVSPAMSSLFQGDHHVWTFAPQLVLPIFQGGKLRGELRLAELRKSSAIAEYEKAIQAAFRDVADGLAGQETYGLQIKAQAQAVASAERRTELSNLRYRAGLDGRLELLDAQRQLYAARQTLLDLRRGELSNTVALYKALGGGLVDTDVIKASQ